MSDFTGATATQDIDGTLAEATPAASEPRTSSIRSIPTRFLFVFAMVTLVVVVTFSRGRRRRGLEMVAVAAHDEQIAILQIVVHAADHLRRALRLEVNDESLSKFRRKHFHRTINDFAELRKIFDDVLFFNGTCGRDNKIDDSIIGQSKCIFLILKSMSNVGVRKRKQTLHLPWPET